MINVYVFELDGSKFYTEFNLGGFDLIRYVAYKLNRTINLKKIESLNLSKLRIIILWGT